MFLLSIHKGAKHVNSWEATYILLLLHVTSANNGINFCKFFFPSKKNNYLIEEIIAVATISKNYQKLFLCSHWVRRCTRPSFYRNGKISWQHFTIIVRQKDASVRRWYRLKCIVRSIMGYLMHLIWLHVCRRP